MPPAPPIADPTRQAARHADKISIEINEIISFFQKEKERVRARFLENKAREPLTFPAEHSALVDKTIRALYGVVAKHNKTPQNDLPCLIALGGYGRAELAPFSDIDLLFLTESSPSASVQKFIEVFCAAFWRTGLKLSHSARTQDDCTAFMQKDLHFLTSLLEKRHICGAKPVFVRLEKSLRAHIGHVTAGTLITAKLAEQDARHRKMGDSRYTLQPNVKESKGALRDIHTLFWLANFLDGSRTPRDLAHLNVLTAQEAETLARAHDFFWRIRCHLHLHAGRADDRLTFDCQPDIAAAMGYAGKEANVRAENFMKDYFLMANETGNLTRILCADIEARALSVGGTAGTRKIAHDDIIEGFPVLNNRLTVSSAAQFRATPADMLRLFRASQTSGHDIHPDALRAVRNTLKKGTDALRADETAYAVFREILLDSKKSEHTLRRLNEANIITALLPDFSNIHAHMQYDMYHVYTADEHTIRAVGMMHALDNGDLAQDAALATTLFKTVQSRPALYAAMFLHDIAKGTGGRHDEHGAKIALRLCPRLGLSGEETETCAWLVEHHLLMTMTALKRDMNDNKTISDFVAIVQSPARLKMLCILTTADIMAVGPDRWNSWKAGLLAELYHKSMEYMAGTPRDRAQDEPVIIAQKRVRRLIGEKKRTLQYLSDYAPKYFWLSFSPKTVARFVADLHTYVKEKDAPLIRITPTAAEGYTEVFVYTPDRKGLFSTLAGAMAAAGASIVEARIFTLTDGMALDAFHVQSSTGGVYDNAAYLQKTIRMALAGKLSPDDEIALRRTAEPKRGRHFNVQPRVVIDNTASASNTVIEVNGRDKIGFLHGVTTALTQAGLQISAAKVTTFGARAVDVFYVKDAFGLKIINRDKLRAIEDALMSALQT